MRALVCTQYGPPDSLVLEQQADPEPGPGEVRVAVKAAGINFPDILSIAGTYQVRVAPPFVPGNEAAGVVEAIGEGVEHLRPGDRVIATPQGGAFADKCVVAICVQVLRLPSAHEQGGTADGIGPRLAGQWAPYLKHALKFVPTGEHMVPPLMERKLGEFSDEDLAALLNYYASQQN